MTSDTILVYSFLTLNRSHTLFLCFHCCFKQVIHLWRVFVSNTYFFCKKFSSLYHLGRISQSGSKSYFYFFFFVYLVDFPVFRKFIDPKSGLSGLFFSQTLFMRFFSFLAGSIFNSQKYCVSKKFFFPHTWGKV